MNANAKLVSDMIEGADAEGQETFKRYYWVVITIGQKRYASRKRVETEAAGNAYLASVRAALAAGATPVNNNKWRAC